MKVTTPALLLAAVLAVGAAAPGAPGQVDRKVPFQVDAWTTLDSTDGPLTLHRIRLAREHESMKSKIMRPNNSEFLQDVRIEIEFSNTASHDWKARIEYRWLDADGKPIDGYNNSENLDSDSRHELQTITLSTLRYGLEKAKTVEIHITYEPD